MVVVMSVLVIVLGALTTLFIGGMRVQSYMSNRFESQQNARLALDKLRREIHCANALTAASYPASTVSVRVGGYCPTADRTTLASALSVPSSGTFSISVASAAPFPASPLTTPACSSNPSAWCIYVGNSGRIECTGLSGTTLTGCTGGAAGTYPAGTTNVAATNDYTWCAVAASANQYSLYRYRGNACSGTGKRWAEHLTLQNVFPASTQNPGELRTLSVDLRVNLKPSEGSQRYELKDDIVLRNSGRP